MKEKITVEMLGWTVNPENKGKKVSSKDCFGCGLNHKKIEAAGIWYCPNPKCGSAGAAWFRSTLDSYEESGRGHLVDEEEWMEKAEVYIIMKKYQDEYPKFFDKALDIIRRLK
jgi:hypothetical protein